MRTDTQSADASDQDSMKQRMTAVVAIILRPRDVIDQHRYEKLQVLRQQLDHAFDRWLPHLTLIPPFHLPLPASTGSDSVRSDLGRVADVIARVCGQFDAHALLVDQVSTFQLRAYTNVHLRPMPTNFQDRRKQKQKEKHKRPQYSDAKSPDQELRARLEELSLVRHPSERRSNAQDSETIVALQVGMEDALRPLLTSLEEQRKETEQWNAHHKFQAEIANGRVRTKGERRPKPPKRDTFKPHISVGQGYSASHTLDVVNRAQSVLTSRPTTGSEAPPGIVWLIDRVQLMTKPSGRPGPYDIYGEYPLRSAQQSATIASSSSIPSSTF